VRRALWLAAITAVITSAVSACSSHRDASPSTIECGEHAAGSGSTPLEAWLAATPLCIAHRGGDADWVEGTADAYRNAAAWSTHLALEVPVWRTADGVWVISEDATTTRVFGADDDIRTSTWATLSALRSKVGGFPIARLVDDVLQPYGRSRILFVDNKADQDVAGLFDLLDRYAGPSRYLIKSYYRSRNTPIEARRRGYRTWGYYYDRDVSQLAATQARFDLLGLNYTASAATFAALRATGKPVIAHVIDTAAAAGTALEKGAAGLMVSAVEQVVRRDPPG
jgi:glycerophosphoryl diester phosphodiesterase